MKRILLSLVLTVISVTLSAVPANREFTYHPLQGGGSVALTLTGDEFYHYWQTADGRIAQEQEDGTFVITDEQVPDEATFLARRRASKRYVNRARRSSIHMPTRVLFILVSYSDKAFTEEGVAYYKSRLGDATPGAKSMYNYLKEQSNGQYAPLVDVYGPAVLSKPAAYYGENDPQTSYDKHLAAMIVEACQILDNEIDFSLYDTDNDGEVDNVYVIYAGKGEADGGGANAIWPQQWNIYDDEGLTLTLDGKKIYSYACSAELTGKGKLAMGTPLHEYSHVIGLPDYYDTEYGTNNKQGRTPGDWTLMDHGSYNDGGNTPPNYSIYDKYYLGWATPKFLPKDSVRNITLTTTTYADGYQINGGDELLSATNTTLMYYIENRQQQGWDAALPGHGMIVWQVQYKEDVWYESNTLNNTAGLLRYTVVSASGDPTKIGRANDPFPGTNEVHVFTPFEGCALTNITEADGLISFKYNVPPEDDPTALENTREQSSPRKVFRNGQVVIIRDDEVYNLLGVRQ